MNPWQVIIGEKSGKFVGLALISGALKKAEP
jgi:hypothetical protein